MPAVKITNLTYIQLMSGLGSLIFAILSIIIGVKILLHYFTVKKKEGLKRKEFISVGLTWIFLSSAWWGGGFCFLSILLFQYAFETPFYLFLAISFIPFALIFWLYSFYHLYLKSRFKLQSNVPLYFVIICCLIYWSIIITLLFYDYRLVGSYLFFQTRPALLPLLFNIIAIIISLITGVLLALQNIKSDKKKIVWKGRFLLISFIMFTIGALLEVIMPLTPIGLILVRLLLILSAFGYYLGFLLPMFLEKWLIKANGK